VETPESGSIIKSNARGGVKSNKMKELASVRVNLIKTLINDEFEHTPEIVLVLSKPSYRHVDVDNIISERKVSAVRFSTNINGLKNLKQFLESLINDIEKMNEDGQK
jgi:hypothetical protein